MWLQLSASAWQSGWWKQNNLHAKFKYEGYVLHILTENRNMHIYIRLHALEFASNEFGNAGTLVCVCVCVRARVFVGVWCDRK